jgi:hypothetical protein
MGYSELVWAMLTQCKVPEELTSRFGDVYTMLKSLDTNNLTRFIENPEYRVPPQDQVPPAGAPPMFISESVELPAETRRDYKYQIRNICSPLAQTLSK